MLQLLRDNPIAAVIIACELGFWVLIALGLVARYLMRLRRTSTVVLAAVPVLDVVLLVATFFDLQRGAPATAIHGLAAIYLGFSIAFGPTMVRWADRHFAHRFAGGPKPEKPAKGSMEKYRGYWTEWYRVVATAAIASATLLLLIWTAAGPEQEGILYWWIGRTWFVAGIWFLAGPAFATKPDQREPQQVTRAGGGG